VTRLADAPGHVFASGTSANLAIDPLGYRLKSHRKSVTLTIKGSREEKLETKKTDFFRREVRYGSFERSVPLREGIKAEDLKAVYRDGVLELSAPMPKEAAPKEVKIQVEASTAPAEKEVLNRRCAQRRGDDSSLADDHGMILRLTLDYLTVADRRIDREQASGGTSNTTATYRIMALADDDGLQSWYLVLPFAQNSQNERR
jgi:Hsp20/alpha crystallin family protein